MPTSLHKSRVLRSMMITFALGGAMVFIVQRWQIETVYRAQVGSASSSSSDHSYIPLPPLVPALKNLPPLVISQSSSLNPTIITHNAPTSSAVSSLPSIVALPPTPSRLAASICGNGSMEYGEECDDKNLYDSDGCSSVCLLEVGVCGDGIMQTLLGEQCEQSLHSADLPFGCHNCRFVSETCGDGTVDIAEECDRGSKNSTLPDADCRPDCGLPRCGDGIKDAVEDCDDANRLNNDGCNWLCQSEHTTPPPPLPRPSAFQTPLAHLQPLLQIKLPVPQTGPATAVIVAAGAASGFGWMRRKKRR